MALSSVNNSSFLLWILKFAINKWVIIFIYNHIISSYNLWFVGTFYLLSQSDRPCTIQKYQKVILSDQKWGTKWVSPSGFQRSRTLFQVKLSVHGNSDVVFSGWYMTAVPQFRCSFQWLILDCRPPIRQGKGLLERVYIENLNLNVFHKSFNDTVW